MNTFIRSICTLFIISLISPAVFAADTYRIKGVVLDSGGDKVGGAEVVLLDAQGNAANQTSTGKRFGGKGRFEFKDVEPGKYTVRATADDEGSASLEVVVEEGDREIELTLKGAGEGEEAEGPEKKVERVPQDEYVLSEISFELKKLAAEVDHLGSQIRDLQAKSQMWTNPLSIYSKEIIMENGSTIFGKIMYQDEDILKVETLVGNLVIDRADVVRIVENVLAEEEPEYVPEQIRETYSPPPMPKLAEPRYVAEKPSERIPSAKRAANVVLVGNIAEKKDRSGNITFQGQLKNIGGRRADFVKINFVFRKNWSGETRTLTTFAKGSFHTFESGITTDSSLLPGATGTFELVVPSDFGPFIGYSPTIDWEEYE
ncbi:MAG: carboxypeptidase-like regulatory domain-containing protein [Fidelibacterota bacterium]